MKIKARTLLIDIFFVVNALDGIGWEIISALMILCFLLKEAFRKSARIKQWKVLAAWVLIWILFVGMQSVRLGLDMSEIARLYGITKCICFPCIVLMMLYSYSNYYHYDIIQTILPPFMIIAFFAIIDYAFGISILSFSGLNSIGAMTVILSAYVFKELQWEKKRLAYCFYAIMLMVVLMSGSRSILLAAAIVFLYVGVTEENKRRRSIYYSLLLVCVIAVLAMMVIFGVSYDYGAQRSGANIASNIARALSVFTSDGRSDQARSDLMVRALAQYEKFSDLQKLIGQGDNRVYVGNNNPPHNCFLEVLLCYGAIGLVLFILFLGYQVRLVIVNSMDKKFALLIIGILLLFGMVQPFTTTGAPYQILAGCMFVKCLTKKTVYKSHKLKKNHRLRYRIRLGGR